MGKKLIVLAMAAAALAAMVVPAAASAHFTLKDHDNEGNPQKVEPGNWVVGTSTNTFTTNTAVGTLFCPHIGVAAEVQKNTGSLITAANGQVGALTNCKAGPNLEQNLTVTSPTLTHLETTGNDEGVASLSFLADVGAFECPFGGDVPFTYATGTGKDTLSLSGEISSPFEFCESEEPTIFEGSYTLTTTNGAPVWVELTP